MSRHTPFKPDYTTFISNYIKKDIENSDIDANIDTDTPTTNNTIINKTSNSPSPNPSYFSHYTVRISCSNCNAEQYFTIPYGMTVSEALSDVLCKFCGCYILSEKERHKNKSKKKKSK